MENQNIIALVFDGFKIDEMVADHCKKLFRYRLMLLSISSAES